MLELYQFESCPYCRWVREKLSELEVDYLCRNVQIGTAKWKEFSALNPNEQVPFLVDPERGVSMEESAEIVKYLERVYGKNR